jgi:histidinol dehydrogenase
MIFRKEALLSTVQSASDLGKVASVLGRAESLTAHARAAEYRIKD